MRIITKRKLRYPRFLESRLVEHPMTLQTTTY